MHRWISVIATLFLVACGPPDMSQDEVKKNLFGGSGVVADYNFGDTWDDVKKKHADVFEVRDDDIKQLRRAVSDNAGDNGYYIGFRLKDGKIAGFNLSISGSKQNAVTVRKILDDVIAHFDEKVGKGKCGPSGGEGNSSRCSWTEKPDALQVSLSYMEMSDPLRGSIDVTISPPKE